VLSARWSNCLWLSRARRQDADNAGESQNIAPDTASRRKRKTKKTTEQTDNLEKNFVRIVSPVFGWVSEWHVQLAPPPSAQELQAWKEEFGETYTDKKLIEAKADMFLISVMGNCRRTLVGDNSFATCGVAAQILQKHVEQTPNLQDSLGRGSCRVVDGSFLVRKRKGGQRWSAHSFTAFEDGSIADITADQFDKVPQLWWPADSSRYSHSPPECAG